jgi:hypothetical protein
MSTRLEQRVVVKTAAYTVRPLTNDRSGTVFSTRGATAHVTFTLPTPTKALIGQWFEFRNAVDSNLTVATTATYGIAYNNAACASLAASTGGQLIGACIRAFCDGASWHLFGNGANTYTVA